MTPLFVVFAVCYGFVKRKHGNNLEGFTRVLIDQYFYWFLASYFLITVIFILFIIYSDHDEKDAYMKDIL